MADIDLARGYRDFAELMDEMGFGKESYALQVYVWNHRRLHAEPAVHVELSAMVAPSGCEQVGAPTLEAALDAMRTRLKSLRDTGEYPAPPTVTVPDAVPVEPVSASGGDDDIPF